MLHRWHMVAQVAHGCIWLQSRFKLQFEGNKCDFRDTNIVLSPRYSKVHIVYICPWLNPKHSINVFPHPMWRLLSDSIAASDISNSQVASCGDGCLDEKKHLYITHLGKCFTSDLAGRSTESTCQLTDNTRFFFWYFCFGICTAADSENKSGVS